MLSTPTGASSFFVLFSTHAWHRPSQSSTMHTRSTHEPRRAIRQVQSKAAMQDKFKNGQHEGITLKINHTGHNQQKHPEDRGISYRLLNIYLTSHNVPFTSRKYTNTDELAVAELSAKYHPNTHLLGECPYTTAAFTDNCGEQNIDSYTLSRTSRPKPSAASNMLYFLTYFAT
jgi:hypothetical protein